MKKTCLFILLSFITLSCSNRMDSNLSENEFSEDNVSTSNLVSNKSAAEEAEIKKDLFKSIFFLDGSYASKIDLYDQTLEVMAAKEQDDPSFLQKRKEFSDAMYNVVVKEKPELIDELYKSINSQDLVRIDAAMENSTNYLTEKLNYFSTAEGSIEAPQCLTFAAVVAAAVWEVVAAVNVAAAVSVFVWKYAKFWPKKASMSELLENETLEKELYLVSLSKLLHE